MASSLVASTCIQYGRMSLHAVLWHGLASSPVGVGTVVAVVAAVAVCACSLLAFSELASRFCASSANRTHDGTAIGSIITHWLVSQRPFSLHPRCSHPDAVHTVSSHPVSLHPAIPLPVPCLRVASNIIASSILASNLVANCLLASGASAFNLHASCLAA